MIALVLQKNRTSSKSNSGYIIGYKFSRGERASFHNWQGGHVYINDPSVSRQHAEIKFIDGRIRLRDLNSTNGTYLVRGKKPVYFREGYVKPHHSIVLGRRLHSVRSLLAVLGIFAEYSDDTGLKIGLAKTIQPIKTVTGNRLSPSYDLI